MLKPGKSHTNNLHFKLFTRAENDTNHRVFRAINLTVY